MNTLDGDGEEKVEVVCGPSEDEKYVDLIVQNVSPDRTDCLVDFVVTDHNQPSYRRCTPEGLLYKHENREKKKYLPDSGATEGFHPLCFD